MANIPIPCRFDYSLSRGKESFESGIKARPYPYKFNYAAGLRHGSYRFRYDRRDVLHIEDSNFHYVRFGDNIIKEKSEHMYVSFADEFIRDKIKALSYTEYKEFLLSDYMTLKKAVDNQILVNKDYLVSIIIKKLEKEITEKALIKKDIYIHKGRDNLLEYKSLELDKEFSNYLLGNIFKILHEYITKYEKLSIDRCLTISKDICDKGLNSKSRYVENDTSVIQVDSVNDKDIDKYRIELDLILDRYNFIDIERLKSLTRIVLKNTEKNLKKYSFKNIHIHDVFKELSDIETNKSSDKNIDLEESLVLSLDQIFDMTVSEYLKLFTSNHNDIDIDKIDFYYKQETSLMCKGIEIIAQKDHMRLLYKDIIEILMYKNEKDELLQDGFEISVDKIKVDLLEKEDEESKLDKLALKNIEKDVFEFLKESLKINLDIEIESEDKKLLNQSINELVKDIVSDEVLLDVVSTVLIELEKKEVDLGNNPIKAILTSLVSELIKIRELCVEIDEDLPLVRLYSEVVKEEDIKISKKQYSIVKEKEIELYHSLRDIDKFKGKDLELYRRFWFIRATEPLDWKIVPYNNYPYEDDPVIFDENKEMIPDNWQLEMVDVENKLFKKIDKNPVIFGKDVSNMEMALSIEIMIEMINILILLWSRLFYAFTGYTGTQSVTRLTRTLYEWLTLETSVDAMDSKKSKKHYLRAYRWIRWEAEKVAIKARNDMNLNGNFYIDEFVFELIYYMENHHFDTIPLFKVVEVMDEYRALIPSDEPQGDIEFVLDKVKGMRHKILDCREKRNNE